MLLSFSSVLCRKYSLGDKRRKKCTYIFRNASCIKNKSKKLSGFQCGRPPESAPSALRLLDGDLRDALTCLAKCLKLQ